MTTKEAIYKLKAFRDHGDVLLVPYLIEKDKLWKEMTEVLDMAIEALEAQDVARERYEDLCEYFNNNPHTIELILNDRKEFKAWLERVHWHVLECDKLARKLEALEGKDTNVPSKDVIYRQDAIDTVEDNILCYTHSDRPIDQDPDTECHKAIRIALRMLRKDLRKLPSAQPSDDYERGWKEGREALREEIWEDERDRLD